MAKEKLGLVLEGGGMKGIYTAGVIDVLLENSIQADIALGTSAGVAFGCNYKSKQIGRVIRYVSKYRNYWRFGSFRSWIFTGDFFGADFCYKKIPDELDLWDAKTFAENPCEFYSVVTDIEEGKAVYYKLTDGGPHDIQYIRASATVPVLCRTVKLDGHKFVDGGMTCSIPLEKAMELGCKKNIVVCTKMEGYGKDGMNTKPLLRAVFRKYPNFVKNINECEDVYEKELALVKKCEEDGSAFVLRPSRLVTNNVAEKNVETLRALYELGRQDMTDRLEELRKWM